jgi:hypothetical protein
MNLMPVVVTAKGKARTPHLMHRQSTQILSLTCACLCENANPALQVRAFRASPARACWAPTHRCHGPLPSGSLQLTAAVSALVEVGPSCAQKAELQGVELRASRAAPEQQVHREGTVAGKGEGQYPRAGRDVTNQRNSNERHGPQKPASAECARLADGN